MQYVYALGTRPLAQYGTTWEYLLVDALGSVRQIVDLDGNVTLAESYEPYGAVLTSHGTGSSIFGYAGEEADTSGLTFLRARYMNPTLGMFLARDPWSGNHLQPATYNGFNYAMENPINLSDPSGLDASSGAGLFILCFDLHTLETIGLPPQIPGINPPMRPGDFITAQQAVDTCRAAYSRANWGYVPARAFDFDSDLPKTAHDLFGWFVYDYRKDSNTDRLYFDANQPLTQELAKSGEMDQVRVWYYNGQLNEPGIREFQFDVVPNIQALLDTWKSAGNLSLSISFFIGSFWYQVVPLDNGNRLGFRIDNDTTLSSGSHIARRYNLEDSVEELIRDKPSLKDKPIRTLISENPMLISILSNRTREETGGLGGGNLYQTYLWSEEYDCAWTFHAWWGSWPHDLQVWDGAGTIDPPDWPTQ